MRTKESKSWQQALSESEDGIACFDYNSWSEHGYLNVFAQANGTYAINGHIRGDRGVGRVEAHASTPEAVTRILEEFNAPPDKTWFVQNPPKDRG